MLLGIVFSAGATVALLLLLRPNQLVLVLVGFAILGFFILPLLPVSMECAAE